jgi:hypothetical protein
MPRGAAHIHPTAHRTTRVLPPLALSRGAFHLIKYAKSRIFSVASRTAPEDRNGMPAGRGSRLGAARMTCRPKRLGTGTSLAGARLSTIVACAAISRRKHRDFWCGKHTHYAKEPDESCFCQRESAIYRMATHPSRTELIQACQGCDWFDSEIQTFAEITDVFRARGDQQLAAVSAGSLEANVEDYRAHIRRDHGPGDQTLLQRYNAALLNHTPAHARLPSRETTESLRAWE